MRCPFRDTQRRRHREKGRVCEEGDRDWSDAATSQDHLEPSEAGGGQGGSSPRAFRENSPCDPWISGF